MFKRTNIGAAVALVLAGVSLQPALAQQSQRVEITGSSIKRLVDTDTALPISVITADELRATGINSAEGVLAKIASSQSITGASQSIGSGTGGAAYANLRGLGSNKTLVLLNGRRVASFAFSSASVDLNSIPFAAIDRVEVLRDGASAIYGTDAIGGVINFITKKNYKGVDISLNLSKPQDEGGEKKGFSLAGGFGDLEKDGFNIWATFDSQDNERIRAIWRDFGATGVIPDRGLLKTSGTTFPANFSQGSLSGNPTLTTCAPPFSLYLPSLSTRACRFDYTAFIDIVPDTKLETGLVRGTAKLGSHYLSLEHMSTSNSNVARVAPDPVTGLSMPPTSPYYPSTYAGVDPTKNVTVGWRMIPAGPRTNEGLVDAQRTVLSAEGAFGSWDYRAGVFTAQNKATQTLADGYVNKSIISAGVRDGKLNPFGDNTAEALALIEGAKMRGDYQHAKGTSSGIDVNATTQMGNLAGGSIGLSVGGEFRKEKYRNDTVDDVVDSVPSLGASPYHVGGDRHVAALSAEVLLPVLKELEVTLAGRYDKYSDFGSTFNPKVAVRYTPVKSVSIRGSYNTGFRAPSLDEIYGPQSVTYTADPYDDPVLCPGGVVAANGVESRDCGQQAQLLTGGNTALQPEKSKTFSIGIALEPVKNLTASVDYWNIKLRNSISSVAEQALFADPAKYAGRYKRCQDLPTSVQETLDRCQNEWANSNALGYVTTLNDNLGGVNTDGFDFALGYGVNSSVGRFQFGWEATYVRSYEYQRDKGDPYVQNVGKYVDASPVLRWQHTLNASWKMGAFGATFAVNNKSGYEDQNAVEPEYFNRVKSYTTADASFTWNPVKYAKITLGVKNLFDTKPPFTNQGTTFQQGYDPRLTDPYGRTLTARLNVSF